MPRIITLMALRPMQHLRARLAQRNQMLHMRRPTNTRHALLAARLRRSDYGTALVRARVRVVFGQNLGLREGCEGDCRGCDEGAEMHRVV